MSVARAVRPKGALHVIILLSVVAERSEAFVALPYVVVCIFGFDVYCTNFDFSRALCCRFFVRPQAELVIILY